jgi:outer membrane protein assembly factor BamB
MHLPILPSLLLGLLSLPVLDDHPLWTRFRGPNGTGVHPSASIPAPIAPDSPSLRWRTEIPPGYSSPVLTKHAVVFTGHEGCFLFTIAVDRASGKVRWRREAPAALERPHNNVNTPCSPTPVSDGENVIVYYPVYGLVAYDSIGKERWRVPLEPLNIAYQPGTSPVLAGDTLLLQADQDTGSYLLALDANTGEQRWRVERPGTTHGFSSPSIYTAKDGTQQAIVSGSYRVTSYDVATGAEVWWASGMAWQAKSVPIIDGDMGYVHSWMAAPSELGVKKITQTWEEATGAMDADDDGLLSKAEAEPLGLARFWFLYDLDKDDALGEDEWGYALARATAKNGLYAIHLDGKGDVTDTHIEWSWKRSLSNIPSPVLAGGVLYVLKEGGVLTGLDPASGETYNAGRIEGAEDGYFASPIAAGGQLLTASNSGKVALIAAGEQWELLELADFGERIWATPAIAADGLYLRTESALYAFGVDEEE